MALTSEERESLFDTLISSETLEDRSEAIAKLKGELEEETTNHIKITSDYEDISTKYLDSQEKLKQALRSIPQGSNSVGVTPKIEEPNNEEPELRGFAKLRT